VEKGIRELCISIQFLSPTYCGNDWPPSPARLFQALVAAAHLGTNGLGDVKEALEWLESKPPPTIIACKREVKRWERSFPRNEFDALLSRIRERNLYPLGFHPSYLPSGGEDVFRKYYEKREPTISFLHGNRTLYYLWPILDNEEEKAKIICKLARKIIYLGWGTDMVIGNGSLLSEEEAKKLAGIRWVPHPRGEERLKVPCTGFLRDVEECFRKKWEEHRGQITLHPAPGWAMYTCEGEIVGPSLSYVGFELIDPNDPDQESTKAFSPERWGEIVGWLRHAVAEALRKEGSKSDEWIRQKVLGHPENSPHFHFCPVPSVGHPHADGFIRRVMICWDPTLINVKEDDLREALQGVALISEGEREEARLRYVREGFFKRFIEPKLEWESVSPIILHGYDHRHGKFSYRKCQFLILQAFRTSGYSLDFVEEISFQKGPFVPGTLHAVRYFVPNHLRGFPMYHVRVKFKRLVRGPIMVGRGRFYGLGLLTHKISEHGSEQVPGRGGE